MDGLEVINKNMKESVAAIELVRSEVDALNGTVKEIKELDAIDREKVEKAADAGGKALQAIQEAQAGMEAEAKERKAMEKRLEDVEKAAARGPVQTADNTVVFSDYAKEIGRHIREKSYQPGCLTLDLVKQNARAVLERSLPHLEGKEIDVLVHKASVAGSTPDGGYFVPIERIARMEKRIFETSPMDQLASSITIGTDSVQLPLDNDEITFAWGGEVTRPTNVDSPEVGLQRISVHNAFTRPRVTENMLEDSVIDIVGWLSMKVEERMGRGRNTAFMTGSGADRPTGWLALPESTDPDVFELGKLGHIDSLSTGAAGTITGDDFFNVISFMKEELRNGAVWMMKRRSFFDVSTLKDGQGQYLMRFGDALARGTGMVLVGSPIFFADDMPNLASDAKAFAYGNFNRAYMIVNRVGITVLVDPYSEDPLIRYRFRQRVGGDVVNYEAIKILRAKT